MSLTFGRRCSMNVTCDYIGRLIKGGRVSILLGFLKTPNI